MDKWGLASSQIIFSYKWVVRLHFDIKEIMAIFNFKRFLKCDILDNSVSLYVFYVFVQLLLVEPQVCLVLSLILSFT